MQLLGVPHVGLCAQTPLETPAPPNPPRVWPHMDMPKCSHPPWSTPPVLELVPKAPCCALLGCGSGMGNREGLGASLSALSIGGGSRTPLAQTPARLPIPAPGPPQCPAGPWFGLELWEASSAPWVSPALVLQSGFSVVGKSPRMPWHEPSPQHSEELQ